MAWYAVFDDVSGELVSEGSVLPETLRPGLAFVEVGASRPNPMEWRWSSVSRSYVSYSPPQPQDPFSVLLAALAGAQTLADVQEAAEAAAAAVGG